MAITRRRKMLVGLAVAVVVLVALGAAGMWFLMQQPLYRPGMVRAKAVLDPPKEPGTDAQTWLVEPGIRLHHFASGDGRSVLVVHGGPGMPFRRPMAALTPLCARFRFHYYDQRGCGQSTRPFDRFPNPSFGRNFRTLERTLGLGAQIADIERVRRLLGDERLILIGHSFGAFTAALYAAEFSERVAGLVLIAPADVLVMPQPDGGLFTQVRAALPAPRRAEYEAFLTDYMAFGRLFERSDAETAALNDRFARFYLEACAARGISMPADGPGETGGFMVQAQYLSLGRRHDYRAAFRAVGAPVLVVHGANDQQPESASRQYAEAFRNGRLTVIADAGHAPFADQPERFAAVVAPFLEDLRAPAR
jgi:proline iminopeptidase